ncbi:YlxR family protein [bacterium]|nr:YlxR family protein [bacterium]
MTEVKRKCVGCGQIKNREEMIKITRRNTDGAIVINPDLKTFGRSAYLCYNHDCIKKSFIKNRLSKVLKTQVNDELKGQLIDR